MLLVWVYFAIIQHARQTYCHILYIHQSSICEGAKLANALQHCCPPSLPFLHQQYFLFWVYNLYTLVHYVNTLTQCLITREIYTLRMRARQSERSEDCDWTNNEHQRPYWSSTLVSRAQSERSEDYDWSRNIQEQSHWSRASSQSSAQCEQSEQVDWRICFNEHFYWSIPRELVMSFRAQTTQFNGYFARLYEAKHVYDENNWKIASRVPVTKK